MVNLFIDPTTCDLSLEDYNLRLTGNTVEWVAQTIENRLKTFLGEWFLNRSLGLPYFQSIFKKQADIEEINSLFLTEINKITEIEEIASFTTTFNTVTRLYLVQFQVVVGAETINGEVSV